MTNAKLILRGAEGKIAHGEVAKYVIAQPNCSLSYLADKRNGEFFLHRSFYVMRITIKMSERVHFASIYVQIEFF